MPGSSDPVVIVIDDDASVREALDGLFRSVGLRVEVFSSAAAYQESVPNDLPGCMVLDIRLPGKSGLEFQEDLVRSGYHRPIVFISGHADVAMCVRAMKAGAFGFLTKPVCDQDLLDAVQGAIAQDVDHRALVEDQSRKRDALSRLTSREREVMAQVVEGRRNKQIAAALNISEGTVKLHRSHIMQKLDVQSFANLVRIADDLKT